MDIIKRESKTEEGILLGIDFGESYIGLALGRQGFSAPIKVVEAKNQIGAIDEIAKIIAENKITKIIMGLPLSVEGKETKESHKVRRFSKLLKARLKKPVIFTHEFLTSKEAVEEAITQGIGQKKRKRIDDISAALILKKYYEEEQ